MARGTTELEKARRELAALIGSLIRLDRALSRGAIISAMFRVLQIDHVELFVPDRYEAARWYERVLGLRIVPEYERWATGGGPLMISTDEGSTKLALFEGTPAPAQARTAAFHRVAFRVTADGFNEFLSCLPEFWLTDAKGQPVTRKSVVDHQKAYSIYFSDPYGHLLEITTYDYAATTQALSGSNV